MTHFRLHDRDLAVGIQAALSEGDRTGPVQVVDVQLVLSMLEDEWAAGHQHRDIAGIVQRQ